VHEISEKTCYLVKPKSVTRSYINLKSEAEGTVCESHIKGFSHGD
jgi:hypothetical protein